LASTVPGIVRDVGGFDRLGGAGAGAGATDLGGNGVATRSWSFRVSNRPVVVLRTVKTPVDSSVATIS
jgi:hypothetical protein